MTSRQDWPKPDLLQQRRLELGLPPHENVLRLFGVAWSIDSARVTCVFELCLGPSLSEALGSTTRSWDAETRTENELTRLVRRELKSALITLTWTAQEGPV